VQVVEPLAAPGDGQRSYRVWMTLDRLPDAPRAGLTGVASVATPHRTPLAHLARWTARYLRLDLWV
jgi:hypothetical protein